jgi:hypothetical protein
LLTYRQKDTLSVLIIIALLILALSSCGAAEPKGTLTTETYIVQPGDTLWSISEKYITKNTAGPRDIREFYHMVIEINYDTVFVNRPNSPYLPRRQTADQLLAIKKTPLREVPIENQVKHIITRRTIAVNGRSLIAL